MTPTQQAALQAADAALAVIDAARTAIDVARSQSGTASAWVAEVFEVV